MTPEEYKEKKFDKLTRDVIKLVNAVPSFGYGDVIDAIAKNSITNHLLSVVRASEVQECDVEILAQSLVLELADLSVDLVAKIRNYQHDIETA